MELLQQFQSIIGSIFLGSIFLFCWTLFNRVFYSKKLIIIRIPFEILLFCLFSYLYYIFICNYSYGIFNIFYIPSLLLGAYLYYRFYAYHFECLFEKTASSINKHLFLPIKLKINKLYDKLKKRRKQNRGKKTNKKN